ncbi:MAG: glycosyltransferase family 4 protein [Cyanobacteria bacterium J06639_16]
MQSQVEVMGISYTPQRFKVLHLITRLAVGGAQDNTLLTVENHSRECFDVHLAANPNDAWLSRAQQSADSFHSLPHLERAIHPIKDLQALFAIINLLRREKFDVVHTHSSKAGILGRIAARIIGVPVVVHTIHGFPFHDFMSAFKRQLYTILERSICSFADFYITVCELNRQQAIALKLIYPDASQTVYSGISFAKLDRPSDARVTKLRLNIPDGWQTIVMVGRLDKQKSPAYLIDAFAKVVRQYPKTLLLLVGEGELRSRLETQTQQLGLIEQVRFLGSRDDVPEILKIADVFALSSLWEGLGRAMTEAMLLGKPVVVPEIYGIPEIVHHHQTGLLFAAGDTQQLANHLIYLLQHPDVREKLGKNAQKLTRERFDAVVMVKQIEAIYDKLLSQKGIAVKQRA